MDIVGLLLIFFARIVSVSCSTIRILFLVRGKRVLASVIGFFEMLVYTAALSHIMGGGREMTVVQMIVYCAGFSAGTFIGSLLEERILNAFVLLEIIMDDSSETANIVESIRSDGYGATLLHGRGKDGVKTILKIICRRSDIPVITTHIDDKGFICITDVKGCTGGYFQMQGK